MGAIDQVINFITSGSIGGIPPLVLMIIPFVIGLVVGYLVPQNAKDRDYSCDHTGRGCLLWVFRFKSWRLERHCRHVWSYSSSIWGTSHGHATTWFRTNRWFCHRLHILIKWVSLETRKVLAHSHALSSQKTT